MSSANLWKPFSHSTIVKSLLFLGLGHKTARRKGVLHGVLLHPSVIHPANMISEEVVGDNPHPCGLRCVTFALEVACERDHEIVIIGPGRATHEEVITEVACKLPDFPILWAPIARAPQKRVCASPSLL